MLRLEGFVRTTSISWLLMTWRLASPGHQQPWYWLNRINKSLSSMRGFVRTTSIPWLLMTWRRKAPGHQQPWHWLNRINRSLSSMRKDWNDLCHRSVVKWKETEIYFYVSSNQFSTQRVQTGVYVFTQILISCSNIYMTWTLDINFWGRQQANNRINIVTADVLGHLSGAKPSAVTVLTCIDIFILSTTWVRTAETQQEKKKIANYINHADSTTASHFSGVKWWKLNMIYRGPIFFKILKLHPSLRKSHFDFFVHSMTLLFNYTN